VAGLVPAISRGILPPGSPARWPAMTRHGWA